MSHIPNAAIPHAAPQSETSAQGDVSDSRFGSLAEFGSGIAEKVREYPKTAAVAGAAVVGIAAAAAAIPAIRGRRADTRGASRKKGD